MGDVTLDELADVTVPLLLQHGKYVSAQDMKEPRFKRLIKQDSYFINNVRNEGVVLFDRTRSTWDEIRLVTTSLQKSVKEKNICD